jgi:predicted acylesterase/phospholipase RssA
LLSRSKYIIWGLLLASKAIDEYFPTFPAVSTTDIDNAIVVAVVEVVVVDVVVDVVIVVAADVVVVEVVVVDVVVDVVLVVAADVVVVSGAGVRKDSQPIENSRRGIHKTENIKNFLLITGPLQEHYHLPILSYIA